MKKVDSNNGVWVNDDPATLTNGTPIDADFMNNIQDEIANVITDNGNTLDGSNHSQLSQTLDKTFAKLNSPTLTGIPLTSNPDGTINNQIATVDYVNQKALQVTVGYATQDWVDGAFISSSYGISQTSDYAGRSLFMREENPVFGYMGPNGLVWLALPTVAQMEAEISARQTADAALQTNINTEASTRLAADNALQTALNTETTQREAADSALQTNINAEADTRATAVTTLTTNLSAETTARENADTTLQTNINTEVAARVTGDNYLNDIKANLGGGNHLTGNQIITDGSQFATTGSYTAVTDNSYDTALIRGVSPNGTVYQSSLREYAGSHYSMLHYIYDGTNFSIYEMPQTAYNGGRLLCPAGTGAVLSDLPTSGTITGGYYTKIGNVLTQNFTVSVSDADTVTFPMAFSATPVPPQITIGQRIDRDNAVYNVTASGFQVYIVGSGPVTITVSVMGE